MEPWWHEVVLLASSGREEAAIAITRKAVAAGSQAAKARLARFGEAAGISVEAADRMVAEVEAVEPKNATTHWALRGAYEVGLGECEYEEKSRRVLRHLEAFAAMAEDPQAAFAVAMNYSTGRIGVPRDEVSEQEWLYIAAALGHPEAAGIVGWKTTPNPSIERTRPGKPGRASHVKR